MKVFFTSSSGQVNAFDVNGAFYSIVPRSEESGFLLRIEVGDRTFTPMPSSRIYNKDQCMREIIRIIEAEARGYDYMVISNDPLYERWHPRLPLRKGAADEH